MADTEEMLPGTFWLAEKPENAVHGRLYLSDSFRLELEGSLTSNFEHKEQTDSEGNVAIVGTMMSEEPGPFTVLGDVRGRKGRVSLFECTTVGRSGDWFMSPDAAQNVEPLYGLRGDHVSEPTGITGVRTELQHSTMWSQAPGFEMVGYVDGTHTLTYKEPNEPEYAILANGASVALIYSTTLHRHSPAGGGFSRKVGIEIDGFPAISVRDAERLYEVPLSSLLTLCLRRECPVTKQFIRQRDGDWLEVLSPALLGPIEDDSDLKPGNHLLMLPDIGLEGVARWLDQVDDLGPLPPVVASIAASNRIQLETALFNLTSIAEGLHQRLIGDADAPVDKDTAKEMRKAEKAALSDAGFSEDHVKAAIESMGGMTRPSYRKRLAELRERVGDVVKEVFGKDFDTWSKVVANCRNDLAHRNLDFITVEASGTYAAVVYSLRWFLIAALLLQTGVAPDSLREKIEQLQAYHFFVQQAPDMLPEVYGGDDSDESAASPQPET